MKLSLLMSLVALTAAAGPVKSPVANIDSSNYLCHVHRVSDTNPEETFKNYIGALAQAGFQTAVFCVGSKRTNYASDVWEPWWSGFDPELGVDQPFFKGTPADETAHWHPIIKQYLDFHARGLDYPALAIRLARGCGLSPWLSVRMNDVHNGLQAGHFKHGSFVKAHPEFRRKTGRSDYSSYALDYAHEEVRGHYLKLIGELLARYDMDGLELDFMREPFLFSDGEEAAGARILTGWLTEKVRPLVAEAAARRGRPVLLSARVPSDPDTATALGLDVKAWIDTGLFDVLVPTPRWATLEFDMPWEKWRTLRGAQTSPSLLAGMEGGYRPCLGVKQQPVTRELLRGAASAALAAGADGIYTFNFFPTDKRAFLNKTSGLGSLEILLADTRTHAVTYRDIVAPTEKARPQLPFSSQEGDIRLAIAPVAKESALTLTIGMRLQGEPFRAPDITLGGHPLKLEQTGTNASGLVTAAGTLTASLGLPAGELVAHVLWGKRKPAEIRSVELTVTPKLLPPLKAASATEVDGQSYDLVVMGGTPGGIACAVRAAREGLTVLLVNHTQHLGGFITSGAGGWEAPYDGLRSPLYGEMRTGATDYYRDTYGAGSPQHLASMPSATSRAHIDRAKVEPRVAEMLFNRMVGREVMLTVMLGHVPGAARCEGPLLKTVTFKPLQGDGVFTVTAKVFADGMYEGDLMAAAGVSNRIGREARSQYNEPHAGVVYTKERHRAPGQRGFPVDADTGLLNIRHNSHATAEIVEGPNSGEADRSVMAYNYRLVLTRNPSNRVMVVKPVNYDAAIARKAANGGFVPNLPNGKVAWNGGRLIGPQNGYPGGDWPERERISRQYLDAMLMALWYIQNDPSVDARKREAFAGYGLAVDEFPDNSNLPYEIYVREARRLVGRAVFTEHDNLIAEGITRTPIHADSVAITDWPVDSVACLPRNVDGSNTDGVFFLAEVCRPAQVPYRCLLAKEVDNLLVPVALSASHVGWGAIRLEPVWMQTGEAAGFAAALAVKHNTTPAALDPDLLIRNLVKKHVMVSFFNDVDVTSGKPWEPAVQYFGTKGFFASYDAKPSAPLTEELAKVWARGFAQLRGGAADPGMLARAVAAAESSGDTTPIAMNRFLTWLHHTDKSKNNTPLTRGEACRLMFKILETAPIPAPGSAITKTTPRPLSVQPVREANPADVRGKTYDLIVVGGTPGGIACAVRAAREGLSVLLVQHNRHIGGMLSNALMQWDALYAGYRSPIFNEVAHTFDAYYLETYGEKSAQYRQAQFTQTHYPMANFEPSVAEHFLNKLVSAEMNITTLLSHYPAAVTREGTRLKSLTLREYGTIHDITVTADTYADATYEGDLAALAKVPYRVGREGRDEYGEPHAGKLFTNISPVSGPKEAVEGKLDIHPYHHGQGSVDTNSPFTADNAIQAYNYRFCLSSDASSRRLPVEPPGYDREEYVHYNRKGMSASALNKKGSFNSAILPGENHAYPDADWPAREKIIERHKNFALGLMYFLQNDASLSEAKRAGYRQIGLPLDEFPDNGNLPYEMYVREARRIVGRYVFKEQDNCLAAAYARTPIMSDSIAVTDWSMDSHDCTTNRRPGFAYDGKLILTEESHPAQIPYRVLLPQGVDNLLVPVCLSATHVAWGAVRLEPVFMQIGEAAGFAAALSKKERTTPAQLDSDRLVRELCRRHFMVTFLNATNVASDDPRIAATQYFGTKGFFADYDARLDEPLSADVQALWLDAFEKLRQGKLDPSQLAAAIHTVDTKNPPALNKKRGDTLLQLWNTLNQP